MWRLVVVLISVGVGADLYLFNGRYLDSAKSVASHVVLGL
jgi:hypothetical protein